MSARSASGFRALFARVIGSAVVLLTFTAAADAAGNAAQAETGLRFEQVFGAQGEPDAVHYRARYLAGGVLHHLEVWRDGEQRLVRRTDDAIEMHVLRQPPDPAYQLTVLDLHRKIETKVDRDDLYRLGQFTDWYDLAHGLRHPKSSYTLASDVAPPAHGPQPAVPCAWYSLVQSGHATKVCWSVDEHLPVLMLDTGGRVLWQLAVVDHKALPENVFKVRDEGFVRNDASADISGD
jgi:hypothetical protein